MTQEAVAENAGMYAAYVSTVERGIRVPSLPTVIRLAEAMGAQPGDLLNDLEYDTLET